MVLEELPSGVRKGIKIGAVTFILAIIFFGSFYIIGPGQRGVLITLGKPSLEAKVEGIRCKLERHAYPRDRRDSNRNIIQDIS